MEAPFALVIFAVVAADVILGRLREPGGPLRLQSESVDVLKIYASFDDLVAISNVNNDTIFECMSARRIEFDPNSGQITLAWIFPSTGEEIPLHIELGDTPGSVTFTVGGDPTPREGAIYYTDYENCVVGDAEYEGNLCSLWTRKEVKDAVPQDCIDHFVDICGVLVPPNSRDLCPDGEGDYYHL